MKSFTLILPFITIIIPSISSSPVTHLDTEFLSSEVADGNSMMIPESLMDNTIAEAKTINEENVSLECLIDQFCYKPKPKSVGEIKASGIANNSPNSPPYMKFSPTNHFNMNEYINERYIKHIGEYEKYGKSINHAEDYYNNFE